MVLITDKLNNIILEFGDDYSYNELETHILVNNIYYELNYVNVFFDVKKIPEEVVKPLWCYRPEDGFYEYEDPQSLILEVPNPYGIPNELYNQIIDDYTEELINDGIY